MQRARRFLEDRRDVLLTLGVVLVAAGFVVMGLGWFGAARKDTIPEQFPYVISGGIVGLGLLGVGSSLIVTQSFRRDHDRIHTALSELRDLLSTQETVLEQVAPALTDAANLVVAGRESYHAPDCHLVAGRTEADLMPVTEAGRQGLEPCRVCKPKAA